MQFLNPVILFGLLAASIPLILHLINLRRNRQIEFSSNRFLEEIKKSNIRNIKVKNLILLILRILIVASVVFAFSRPVIESSVPLLGVNQPSSNIIVVDNSFSMDMPTGQGEMLLLAKNKAKEIIESLPPQSEAVVIDGAYPTINSFSTDVAFLSESIDEIESSHSSVDLSQLSELIGSIWNEASYPYRNVFLLTDNQIVNQTLQSDDYPIYIQDYSSLRPAEIANLAIDSVRISNQLLLPGGEVEIVVFLRNTGNTTIQNQEVMVKVGGRVIGKSSLDIEAGNEAIRTFQANVPSDGVLDIIAEIDKDIIEKDNQYHIVLSAPPFPNIALIGTDESTYYLRTLLKTSAPDKRSTLLSANDMMVADLSKFDLLIIASGALRQNELEVLKQNIFKGIPALIFAPYERTDRFQDFLYSLGYNNAIWKEFGGEPQRVNIVNDHPVLSDIYREDNGVIDNIAIQTSLDIQGTETYVRAAGGTSLFVASRDVTQGYNTVFIGVSSDLTYSDFPLLKIFAPYIYRTSLYLSGIQPDLNDFYSGQYIELQMPSVVDLVDVFTPDGNSYQQSVMRLGSTSYLDLGISNQIGNFIISDENNRTVNTFSVNHHPFESTFEYDIPSESNNIVLIDADRPLAEYISGQASQTEIWQLFVILAILLAIIELWIGNTISS